MQILKISLGFLALVLAWSLLFRTGLIFRLNFWLKENVFNDQVVLYSRRRVALLLFLLGVVSLFSGVENVMREPSLSPLTVSQLLKDAQVSFKNRDYPHVVNLCRILLKADSKNIQARELMAKASWALGDKEEARKSVHALMVLDPDNPTVKALERKLLLNGERKK